MPFLKCLTQKLNKKTFIKFQLYFDQQKSSQQWKKKIWQWRVFSVIWSVWLSGLYHYD